MEFHGNPPRKCEQKNLLKAVKVPINAAAINDCMKTNTAALSVRRE
jgi:hypothetical protein